MTRNKDKPFRFMKTFEVPDYDRPELLYMKRWEIVVTPWFSILLHRFETPDPRPTLHDHPWSFVSLILRGGYNEQVGYWYTDRMAGPIRKRRWINVKRAGDFHAITNLLRVPTWTLMFTGWRRRKWGYLEPGGKWTVYDQHPHAVEYDRAVAERKRLKGGAS
jgi:hypothetical protein